MTCDQQPGLIPLETGIKEMLSAITPCQTIETISLADAAERVLAKDIQSPIAVPSFDNSAMDGYAINATESTTESFTIQGQSMAGSPYLETLKANHAVRIMTGAAIPHGADTVIMQESAVRQGDQVTFTQIPTIGNNIRKRGEDVAEGDTVLPQGSRLNAANMALLASVGSAEISVYAKTKVGLMSTGDELKQPGQSLSYGDIYDSNRIAVKQMLQNLSVEVIDYGIIADNEADFTRAFKKADSECDFVISSGGVSVGEADYTKTVLEQLGRIDFWKLAIKPGKPFAFGQLPNSYFIGLPGNPVSAIVTMHVLASQAIRQHQHIGHQPMKMIKARSATDLKKAPGRLDFQRGHWQLNAQGEVSVEPVGRQQGSHILHGLANANCYIALEQERSNVSTGEWVDIWLFDHLI